MPRLARNLIFRFFLTITPRVPVVLTQGIFHARDYQVCIWGAIFAFVLAFVINLILTWLNGTLFGDDASRIYFTDDIVNIILYTSVVPAYVGCSSALIAVTVQKQAFVRRITERFGRTRSFSRRLRFPIVMLIIPIMSSIFTYNYISDVLDNSTRTYWFMEHIAGKGNMLNEVGIYYVVLNFLLLTLLVTANFCFFSLFLEVINVGYLIGISKDEMDKSYWPEVKLRLEAFTRAYMWAKIVCLFLAINVYLWKQTDLGQTTNLRTSMIVLSLMGLFFISFPRYYVEVIWRDYHIRSGSANRITEFDDLRDVPTQFIVVIVDVALFGILLTHLVSLPDSASKILEFVYQ